MIGTEAGRLSSEWMLQYGTCPTRLIQLHTDAATLRKWTLKYMLPVSSYTLYCTVLCTYREMQAQHFVIMDSEYAAYTKLQDRRIRMFSLTYFRPCHSLGRETLLYFWTSTVAALTEWNFSSVYKETKNHVDLRRNAQHNWDISILRVLKG